MINSEDIGSFLEVYSYENLLEQALDRVPAGIDTREGSIIYDALAISCYQLADMYMQLKMIMQDSFVQSAAGDYLDLKISEYGITRFEATRAVRVAIFTSNEGGAFDVPLGARFATIETDQVFFTVTQKISDGRFLLQSEEDGTRGNSYHGQLLPLTNIEGLATAIIDEVATPGQNEETDEELRGRFFNFINQKSFGGNFSDYVVEVSKIDGVGGTQIYPVWNGGGTVKVVIIDSELNLSSQIFIDQVKELIDPKDFTGRGLGFAPIGHKVTVTTANRVNIDIDYSLDLVTGYQLPQVEQSLNSAINKYFMQLRENWSVFNDNNQYELSVFRSQLVASLISVEGVANIENLLLNKKNEDIKLNLSNDKSELPFVGVVTIHG